MAELHPDLEEGSPFSHPDAYQDWIRRKSGALVPYDVVIFAKDLDAAYVRMFDELDAESAAYVVATGLVFFRLNTGKFAVITSDIDALDDAWPKLEFWNWWTETMFPDLELRREKEMIDKWIAEKKFH